MKRPIRTTPGGPTQRGQTLVEFALVFPIFFVLLMGMIEFGLVFNALLQHQLRQPRRLADRRRGGQRRRLRLRHPQARSRTRSAPRRARAGSPRSGSTRPTRTATRSAPQVNVYARTGSTTCTLPGGAPPMTVPYTLIGSAGYLDTSRCNVQGGCGGSGGGRHDRGEDHLRLHAVHPARARSSGSARRLHPGRVERDADGAGPVSRPASPDRPPSRSRGQSLVEFAVSVPVFVMLLFGMLEFGFAFSHNLTLEYATREGARTGRRPGSRHGRTSRAPRSTTRSSPRSSVSSPAPARRSTSAGSASPDLPGERRPAARPARSTSGSRAPGRRSTASRSSSSRAASAGTPARRDNGGTPTRSGSASSTATG